MTITTLHDRDDGPDVAAEEAVLGAMLLSTHAIDDASALHHLDFQALNRGWIYEAITDQHAAGQPADPWSAS